MRRREMGRREGGRERRTTAGSALFPEEVAELDCQGLIFGVV